MNHYLWTRPEERRDIAAGLIGVLWLASAGTAIVSILFTILS